MKKRFLLIISIFLFGAVLFLNFTSAFGFNGTVYDPNGAALNNSVVNISVRSLANWLVVGYNFTTTNESGWFNITVTDTATWMYEPKITFRNGTGTSSYIAYVGQSLPAFPSAIFNQLGSTSFYLKESGTINITAVNSSGHRTTFDYQIKDTRLGYAVAQSFSTGGGVLEANIIVPRDRNYSIMIFPNNSLPVSFSWNNFTSTSTYIIPGNAAGNATKYNVTTRTLHKTFNTTLSIPEVTGSINATNVTSSLGWDDFGIAAYILEPGNMIHVTQGAVPSNLSFFRGGSATDYYNLTNGYYNITLPASAEESSYILFATARNGTGYYGGFANLTLSYGSANVRINFSMYGLLGAIGNISVSNAANFAAKKNIATRRQNFQLVNITNASLGQSFVHSEITVDYSSYAKVMEFTWMEDVGQESNSNFSLPLLNVTGIKEMNIFAGGGNYAPKRIAPTVSQLITNNLANSNVSNITMNSFNPQAIETSIQASSITMGLYISNATCDVPDPPNGCVIGNSANMQDFNPMGAIIGGGKLSFRMGTAGILVHYVNVDLMASGPPDALFDEKTKNGTAGSDFNTAVRFGSGGPTVYDYILVSIPYSESAGTGLNDTATVNMSIPVLYDDSWNVLWNVTLNGTNASALGGNYSHYSARQGEWQYLLSNTSCVTAVSSFNVSSPCYINTTSNNIWIRLPHFSGTGPNVKGTALVATTSSSSTSSSSSSSSVGTPIAEPTKTKSHLITEINPGKTSVMKINDKDIGVKEISIEVNNPAQNVKITVTKYDGKPAEVSVEKSGKVYKYLEVKTQNLENKLKKGVMKIQVEKSWLKNNGLDKDRINLFKYDESSKEWKELNTKYVDSDSENEYYEIELTSFSFFAIAERVEQVKVEEETPSVNEEESIPTPSGEDEGSKSKLNYWAVAGIFIIVLVILGGIFYWIIQKKSGIKKNQGLRNK